MENKINIAIMGILFLYLTIIIVTNNVITNLKKYPQCLNTDNPVMCIEMIKRIGG